MIRENEYKQRRDCLLNKLSNNSIAIVFSATNKTRSNDTQYPYRQDSSLYYLTGFKEDNSALVLIKYKNKTKSILFVQKKDKNLELWTGKRLGIKKAKQKFKIDEIYESENLKSKLKEFLKDKKSLYCDLNSGHKKIKKVLQYAKSIENHKNISLLVGQMRLIKSENEIKLIKKAIGITANAHHYAMSSKKIGKKEYELQAEIEYIFKRSGAFSDAYTSIIACGNSANTLHYINNNKILVNNELILIDAGCEYDYYASDITRTIPVNGKFSEAQAEIYQLVLDTQIEIIKNIKPGVNRTKLQSLAELLLTRGMVKLGILHGSVKKLIKNNVHKKYYPHGIGHWMGIDVHDQAPYLDNKEKEIPLASGMVLTIEPGLYINKDDKRVPKKYRGIGIRIEDDILVTKYGNKNLSSAIVKRINEIEKLSQV
ncbi:MAG: xaa-pro aminopeptidase [Sulfurimonas sp.]|nr:MAG: xaa-pro aminopeptidase [Sulfurimonas sp.]